MDFSQTEKKKEFSDEEARILLKLARKTIEEKSIQNYSPEYNKFLNKRGAFVTINKIHKHTKEYLYKNTPQNQNRERGKELRGCIGFIMPIYPLWLAVSKAAYSAAHEDPRFNPLKKEEFRDISIELSILSVPKIIEVNNPDEYLEKIKIGRDGLIIERDYFSGVLLPQVPIEWNWNVEEFLNNLCLKANMESQCWKSKETKIFSFYADIYEENI
jgi:uncharacterized protein (TIGR00296 family)